jgi:hypothetical protein
LEIVEFGEFVPGTVRCPRALSARYVPGTVDVPGTVYGRVLIGARV